MLFTKFAKIRRILFLQYKKCLLVSLAKLLSQTHGNVLLIL